MAEVVKHKKDLSSLKMSEDEAITFYTFSIFIPGLFGGKRSTKSYIVTLPNYTKWRNKYLQTGLGYEIEEMLDPVHWDIKMIITIKYQSYPHLRALVTEISLKSIEFISTLIGWIGDTYESLLTRGNIKEDFWWITTRVIRSIFEYYLSPARSIAAKISFDSDSQRRSTIIWGVIKGHLATGNILENPSIVIPLLLDLTLNGLLVTLEENKPWIPRLWLIS